MTTVEFDRLNITSDVLDKLGFSEYDAINDDEWYSWGTRTLMFTDGTKFIIAEIQQIDDYVCDFGVNGYVSHHYEFFGFMAEPTVPIGPVDLFFLHEMYECIATYYPDCLEEFTDKCKAVRMYHYIDSYLKHRPEQ